MFKLCTWYVINGLLGSYSMFCQIDRHNTYRELTGLFMPHHEFPKKPLRDSLVDGELVIDVDPKTNKVRLTVL
jgi:mRNA guanylyltransferase